MMSSGINLVMTVIGFAVSTMFIVFVCTRLICARIQLSVSRRSLASANRSDLSILERGLHGLEPIIFTNFPTKKYSDAFFSSEESNQCTVCLADYHQEDTLRILPSCGHFFHAACIDIWLHQHSTCPVCRVSLRELPEKKRFMQPLFSSAMRAQYTIQHANTRSYHSSNTRRPSMPHDSQRVENSQDECCQSEGVRVEDRESNPTLSDDCHITKKSANKEVESPSNA